MGFLAGIPGMLTAIPGAIGAAIGGASPLALATAPTVLPTTVATELALGVSSMMPLSLPAGGAALATPVAAAAPSAIAPATVLSALGEFGQVASAGASGIGAILMASEEPPGLPQLEMGEDDTSRRRILKDSKSARGVTATQLTRGSATGATNLGHATVLGPGSY